MLLQRYLAIMFAAPTAKHYFHRYVVIPQPVSPPRSLPPSPHRPRKSDNWRRPDRRGRSFKNNTWFALLLQYFEPPASNYTLIEQKSSRGGQVEDVPSKL